MRRFVFVAALGLGMVLASATAAVQSRATPGDEVVDDYDRNVRLWRYQRIGKSGWQRGMELFHMKCWMCHNEYTIREERDIGRAPAPSLLGLSKRINNEQVAKQVAAFIRSGGPRMPAFTPATLTDQDVADLLAYMRECGAVPRWCFDGTPSGAEHNPAPNPWYRGGPQ